jgi:L-alanine-DL-glutamate epimerase-like enolase superfamily enzyme
MKADNWEGHRSFQTFCFTYNRDESCIIEEDVAKCHNHFHGINIKLVKCGGLTPARRMIQEAKTRFKTMVGCMTESSVGISAIAHLLPQWIMLIWTATCGRYSEWCDHKKGKVSYSERNGTGVLLITLKVNQFPDRIIEVKRKVIYILGDSLLECQLILSFKN